MYIILKLVQYFLVGEIFCTAGYCYCIISQVKCRLCQTIHIVDHDILASCIYIRKVDIILNGGKILHDHSVWQCRIGIKKAFSSVRIKGSQIICPEYCHGAMSCLNIVDDRLGTLHRAEYLSCPKKLLLSLKLLHLSPLLNYLFIGTLYPCGYDVLYKRRLRSSVDTYDILEFLLNLSVKGSLFICRFIFLLKCRKLAVLNGKVVFVLVHLFP